MSIEIMARVWKYSHQKSTRLLALLALADYCNDEGVCWPSVETLSRKIRMEERNTQRILTALQRAGEVYRGQAAGRGHTNNFAVLIALPPDEAKQTLLNWFELSPQKMTALLKKVQKITPFKKVQKVAPHSATSRVKGATSGKRVQLLRKRVQKVAPRTISKHQQEPSKNRQQQQPPVDVEINKRLDKLGIAEPTRSELAAMKPGLAYLDGLIAHKRKHPLAGAGLYVAWVRGGITPPQAAKQKWFSGYEDFVNR